MDYILSKHFWMYIYIPYVLFLFVMEILKDENPNLREIFRRILISILLLYTFIPEPSLIRNVLIVCVILPIGMTILPFADELNYDSRIAGVLVNISLLISFLLMWGLVVGLKLA